MPPPPPGLGFRDLEWFLVLVEEQHFGRAAERLGITQSALARAIRRVEAELDAPLVTRKTPMVNPTPAGASFAAKIRDLLGELEMATAEARRAANVPAPVRVGCAPDLVLPRLQSFLGALYARHPDLDVDVVYLSTAEQIRRLRTGRVDIGLIRHVRDVEGIEIAPAFPGEPLAAFLPLEHPLAGSGAITPADLAGEVLVTTLRDADPILSDRMLTLLSSAGYKFRAVREILGQDPRSLLLAVAHHHGVAVGADSALEVVGDVSTLVSACPPKPPSVMPDTVLAWRVNPLPELYEIISLARSVASSMYAG